MSGTMRVRHDGIEGQPRPGFNESDSVINLRTSLFAQYDTGTVRFGAELYDSRAWGGDARTPISTNEVNAAELVQAYAALDLEQPFNLKGRATLKAGRFVLNLGSRRLVAADDYRNTTNAYAGVHGAWRAGPIQADVIHVSPVRRLPDDLPSLLDNGAAWDQASSAALLTGVVASRRDLVGRIGAEATILRFRERDSADLPTRDRRLLTWGGRLFAPPAPGEIDFEVEAFRQTGSISTDARAGADTAAVEAGFLHLDVGYSFDAPLNPRVSARYDWIGGDRSGPTFERFDTLFGMRRAEIAPSGLYNAVGRANMSSPAVRLEWTPNPLSDAFIHYRLLWLASETDSFSTSAVRDSSGGSGRFAGHQLEARWRQWLVEDALRWEIGWLELYKGRFLTEAPGAPATGDTRYISLNVTAFF